MSLSKPIPKLPSLPEVHGSVPVPEGAGFWREIQDAYKLLFLVRID